MQTALRVSIKLLLLIEKVMHTKSLSSRAGGTYAHVKSCRRVTSGKTATFKLLFHVKLLLVVCALFLNARNVLRMTLITVIYIKD